MEGGVGGWGGLFDRITFWTGVGEGVIRSDYILAVHNRVWKIK